jgi:FKBP-type peptidyl-prolyl cis-trans isomerase SlyD
MGARVISFHYTLTDPEGNQLDSSQGGDPLSYLEGSGRIIPGLESALSRLEQGDKREVRIAAKEAYGERSAENVFEVPIGKLPTDEVKVGDRFRAGEEAHAPVVTVTRVENDQVTLDGNHPLAGVDLTFDVEITGIREATDEEMEHGHVHGPGGAHD